MWKISLGFSLLSLKVKELNLLYQILNEILSYGYHFLTKKKILKLNLNSYKVTMSVLFKYP